MTPIYVLEEVGTNGVVVKHCSDNEQSLDNYKRRFAAMSNAAINSKPNSFIVTGLQHIYSVVDDKNGVYADIGQYFKTKQEAENFVLSPQQQHNNLKVDCIMVI